MASTSRPSDASAAHSASRSKSRSRSDDISSHFPFFALMMAVSFLRFSVSANNLNLDLLNGYYRTRSEATARKREEHYRKQVTTPWRAVASLLVLYLRRDVKIIIRLRR